MGYVDMVITALVVVFAGMLLWWLMTPKSFGCGKPPTPRERTEMESMRMQLLAAEGAYGRMLTLLVSDVQLSATDTIVCFLAIFGIETRRVDIPEEVLDAIGDPSRFKAALEKHYDLVIETSWRDR